jgi:flagellin
MIINHNLGASNAIRNMSINSSAANKSMQKLSSGLRINTAGDDAAGLAISEKMRGQIRGLDQASANAQDGISLVQTAEGALNETTSILQRMRELSVQAANDTINTTDRGAIKTEMDQLTQEIDRIGNTTEFNTKKLLNGSAGLDATVDPATGLTVIDGGNAAAGTVTFSAGSITAAKVAEVKMEGAIGTAGKLADGDLKAGTFTLNGQSITLGSASVDALVAAVNAKSSTTGVIAVGDSASKTFSFKSTGVGSTTQIKIDSFANVSNAAATTKFTDVTNAGTATVISASDTNSGKNAVATATTLGGGTLGIAGNTISVVGGTFDGMKFAVNANTATGGGNVVVNSNSSLTYQIGANAGQTMSVSINDMRSSKLGLGSLDVSNTTNAQAAVTTIQTAIETVSAERSKLGAYSNRLEHTIANLGTSSENLTSAESRIRDVDMAKEMATFSKNNILSQAAQAMLAQANQQPQQVLQLLR